MLMAPRGCGVLTTMLFITKLMQRVDSRLIISFGYLIAAYSLWMMTGWTIDMSWDRIILSGYVQGLGLGCAFLPTNLIGFSCLKPELRQDGSTVMSLVRNLASSFGISVIVTILSRNIQISHADIAANVTETAVAAMDPAGFVLRLGDRAGAILSMVNGEVTRQAMMIAYLDNFYMLFWLLLCFVPVSLLVRNPRGVGVMPQTAALDH
jgi:DHA2 family multidrug resistance protein